ncbi:MAG: sulfatase family protein [Opitutales bacterium]
MIHTIRRLACVASFLSILSFSPAEERPNIVLVMTDDQGWGQTGYYKHPYLKTPNLDAMAENGLRFDRFYAGAPVCSPTRATVLTGRQAPRTGVPDHGYALRLQEKTIAQALKDAGYATGHFGKWHLNALRGPGAPILKEDTHGPGAFGFEEWLTVTNFFDIDPLMSRKGEFEEFTGDSSDIIARESLKFIQESVEAKKPFFAVVWDGSPHSPFVATEADMAPFSELDTGSQKHHGELVAFDRSVGVLRQGLRDLGVAENTIVWFCSDNGGLDKVKPNTVGGLRGYKGDIWEGGIRVPGIIEWPAKIKPRITDYPAATMDIFPTIAELAGLPDSAMLKPLDGISLASLFTQEIEERPAPLAFFYKDAAALIDNDFKLVSEKKKKGKFTLYNLSDDPSESTDISSKHPELFKKMMADYTAWFESVQASIQGKDYPEGAVDPNQPARREWYLTPEYEPYLDDFIKRPEFKGRLEKKLKSK